MKSNEIKSVLILMLTAVIWGFAFVAQRVGMEHVGAFTYNGVRFALGSLSLLPLIYYLSKRANSHNSEEADLKTTLKFGIILGCVLFTASSLQQVGLIYTTAGKAGFITSLYIVLVPIFGIFLKHRTHRSTWIGALTAATGLYLLSVNENFTVEFGDILEIIGAVFWTIQILLVDKLVRNINPVKLSCVQFVTCSFLSMTVALIFEDVNIVGITEGIAPILYGGIMSVGIAFTLQAVAQKGAKPSHAAIAMSMESVFAAIGGALILSERLPLKGYLGCGLIFAGMLISQAENFIRIRSNKTA